MRIDRTFLILSLIAVAQVAHAQQQTRVPTVKHHTQLERQAQQAAAKIERRLNAVEQHLKQQETRMNARLQQLNNMRAAALKRNDEATLKKIERLETQAIQRYEASIQSILKSADVQQPRVQPKAQTNGTQRKPRQVSSPKSSPNRRVQQSRRGRFWPF